MGKSKPLQAVHNIMVTESQFAALKWAMALAQREEDRRKKRWYKAASTEKDQERYFEASDHNCALKVLKREVEQAWSARYPAGEDAGAARASG